MRLIIAVLAAFIIFAGVAGTKDVSAEQVTAQIGLNLRSGPGTEYSIIVTMPYGATVTVLSWTGAWAQVTYAGITGWAHGTWIATEAYAAPSSSTPSSGGSSGGYSWITGGYYPGDVVTAIYYWAGYYGISGDRLYCIAYNESGLDPNAVSFRVNPVSGQNDIGLFQFQPSTFYAYGGVNLWDYWDQARVAASMFASGLGWHWVTAGGC